MACDHVTPDHLSTHVERGFDAKIGLYDEAKQRQCVITLRIPGEAPIASGAKTGNSMVALEEPGHASYPYQQDRQECEAKRHFDDIQHGTKSLHSEHT